MAQIRELLANKMKVKIYETRLQMGDEAAYEVGKKIKELLLSREFVNIIFAAAPSQNEFLSSLSKQPDVDWSRVNAFHMDEYMGLDEEAPQRFSQFLKERIFDKVPINKVYYINGNADDPNDECRRYSHLLKQYPTDIVCMGIGENAHIAFNDPHVADFNDLLCVKVVILDEASRQQQVNDSCFERIEDVPTFAITLTVPALLQANYIYCIVPGAKKAAAIYYTMNSEVNEKYPSTSLRNHNNAILYLDEDSAAKSEGINF
ncbi:MAG TPA: glucosamine-6-phosphate deaminase [Hanamia sp.]